MGKRHRNNANIKALPAPRGTNEPIVIQLGKNGCQTYNSKPRPMYGPTPTPEEIAKALDLLRESEQTPVWRHDAQAVIGPLPPLVINFSRLCAILHLNRRHGTAGELALRKYIMETTGATDIGGALALKIGDSKVSWSCHTDTVDTASAPPTKRLAIDRQPATGEYLHERIVLKLEQEDETRHAETSAGTICYHNVGNGHVLGADDGAGVEIMLTLIGLKVPGVYLFHQGEEIGGIGSSAVAKASPPILSGIECMIALDRHDDSDIICHQSGGVCASREFARSLATHLPFGYQASDRGIFTDSANYTHLISECTNLSVGYLHQHSRHETLDIMVLDRLARSLIALPQDTLTFSRDPFAVSEDSYFSDPYWGHGHRAFGRTAASDRYSNWAFDDPRWSEGMECYEEAEAFEPSIKPRPSLDKDDSFKPMIEYIRNNPDVAVEYLVASGIEDDFAEYVYDSYGQIVY